MFQIPHWPPVFLSWTSQTSSVSNHKDYLQFSPFHIIVCKTNESGRDNMLYPWEFPWSSREWTGTRSPGRKPDHVSTPLSQCSHHHIYNQIPPSLNHHFPVLNFGEDPIMYTMPCQPQEFSLELEVLSPWAKTSHINQKTKENSKGWNQTPIKKIGKKKQNKLEIFNETQQVTEMSPYK